MASLNAYVVTFNCGRELIKSDVFGPHILQAASETPDLLILCLQELAPLAYAFLGGSFLTPYFDRFTAAVQVANKDLYSVINLNVGLTAIMIFAKEDVSSRIGSIQTAEVGVGMQQTGHKGAVGIRMHYENTSLTFVSAHLAPHEPALEKRNQDYREIVERLVFVGTSPGENAIAGDSSTENGMFARSHIVFAGDLNYRTSSLPPTKENAEDFPQPTKNSEDPLHWSHLLPHDQLNEEVKANKTLQGLQELPISFPPTYKYTPKDEVSLDSERHWPWAAHRWPSWCDRIFFSKAVDPRTYEALPLFGTSDHRPVALSLSISLGPVTPQTPPFKVDPDWQAKRAVARRKELAVGTVAYLTWTKEGNGLLLASVIGLCGFILILRSMLV